MEIADLDLEGGSYNGVLRRYIPGAATDERVALITVNPATGATIAREYYHANRLGSVIAMADETGAITAQYVYTPCGVESPYNASGNPFRYTGRRLDAQWGVYYYRARYYDPQLGRFLETDPAGYVDSMNLYAYVGHDPLNATDPTGMCGPCVLVVPFAVKAAIATAATLAVYFGAKAVVQVVDLVQNAESSEPDSGIDTPSPGVPPDLVGSNPRPSSGVGIKSDGLAPENGGTGNPEDDFDALTGGQGEPADPALGRPPGTVVAPNGIQIRPGRVNDNGTPIGPRIDIPANGAKPPETLHYPPAQ